MKITEKNDQQKHKLGMHEIKRLSGGYAGFNGVIEAQGLFFEALATHRLLRPLLHITTNYKYHQQLCDAQAFPLLSHV